MFYRNCLVKSKDQLRDLLVDCLGPIHVRLQQAWLFTPVMPTAGGETPWQVCLESIAAEAVQAPPIQRRPGGQRMSFTTSEKQTGFIEAAVQLHGLEPLTRM